MDEFFDVELAQVVSWMKKRSSNSRRYQVEFEGGGYIEKHSVGLTLIALTVFEGQKMAREKIPVEGMMEQLFDVARLKSMLFDVVDFGVKRG